MKSDSYCFVMSRALLSYGLFCLVFLQKANEATYVTGAPVGLFSEGEPVYQLGYSSSVDWFPGKVDGSYYLAIVAPDDSDEGSVISKTVAVYQFEPEDESLVFIDSAPTGQFPAGSGTSGPADGRFSHPKSVSWFPGEIGGNYYFTVVGDDSIGAEVRLYQFVPATPTTDGAIIFIDSAPVVGEDPIPGAYSVSWFPEEINGQYYLGVGLGSSIDLRVYAFNQTSQTISWEGAAAITGCDWHLLNFHAQVSWSPGLLNGEMFLVVGDKGNLRVYRFCPNECWSGSGVCPFHQPQSLKMELVTTTSTTSPGNLNQPWGVCWLKIGQEVYIIAGCESGKAKLFQFLQDNDDTTKAIAPYVTEVPTNGISCRGEVDSVIFNAVKSVDWLIKDGAYYLVIGGDTSSGSSRGGLMRLYQFDPRRKHFEFLAEASSSDELLAFEDVFSVDWLSKQIGGECYFASGVVRDIDSSGSNFGSQDSGIIRIYSFDPLCPNSLISWRHP